MKNENAKLGFELQGIKTEQFAILEENFSFQKEIEKVLSKLPLSSNRYINDALNLYNQYSNRKLLKLKLTKESKIVAKSSSEVLAEFDTIP